MFRVLKIMSVMALLCIVPLSNAKRKVRVKHGPTGMNLNESTTCEEFAKYARFNPYSVLDKKWFVFYYWGPPRTVETYIFTFPSANHTKYLHKIFDGKTFLPMNWTARHILMERENKEVTLLVERGDRGQYWGFVLQKAVKGQKIRPRDLRIKQTGDNKIIGIMDCDSEVVLAMSQITEVPPKKRLQDEAARLGYRARRGKSYLYEGHEWMPIPEADEKLYWAPKWKQTSSKESSSEERSTSKEENDTKKTDESSNVPKDQVEEDQTSREQVDNKESNNENNSEASEEIKNKEKSEELSSSVDESNKVSVTDAKDEKDNSARNDKQESKSKKPKKVEKSVSKKSKKEKKSFSKKSKKEGKKKLKLPKTMIEPEVISEQEVKEMELMTISEPYSDQSKQLVKRKDDDDEDECKSCFTLKQRLRQPPKPMIDAPDIQNSLQDPTNPAMETKHENKSINEFEKGNDDESKDLNTDKNEV